MAELLYRKDMDGVRERLTAWWHGENLGRPAMIITVPRDEPHEVIPALPEPPGWMGPYSTADYDYRVNLGARWCTHNDYLGEAVPHVEPDLAPNCVALYLGCKGVESPGTVWCEPFITEPDSQSFDYDPDNFYWDFSMRLAKDLKKLGQGKFLLQFPDLIEGLDTLAAMRDTQALLTDMILRPEWVHDCMRKITDLYFRYYDRFYDLMRDEVGGSVYWVWGPGRTVKLQCDYSAMISAEMFNEFMLPVLQEMTARISYNIYHWDGPGALQHHDALLSLDKLQVIQWTPGDGAEPPADKRWWPYFHKTIDAGKNIYTQIRSLDEIRVLKREFGKKLYRFILVTWAKDRATAEAMLREAEVG